ncbi:MAG: DUF72 domain-containing protein [Candidatus Marsarchaeota archaeon]|nr:DUF72 domain-containing protein [Candidatus Marsarchaeota archaeon]
MRCSVGTSGWMYTWNEGHTLDWYIRNSGLNAIELNASFYRFPSSSQVSAWSAKRSLDWVVKVNRYVTHMHMLNDKAVDLFGRFLELFRPLDKSISLYLLQMPPKFTANMQGRLLDFVKSFDEKRLAVEFRHSSWYSFDFSRLDFKGVVVSPDSPEVHGRIWDKNNVVYMRFHGRRSWYSYMYSKKELGTMASMAMEHRPSRIFAFFNNDHDMLQNAREFRAMLEC